MMEPMISYVIYDPVTLELISSHQQVPSPEHIYRVLVTDEQRQMWPLYLLNADRTGLVKNPLYFPDEFPPVDPDPEPPVQSGN